MKTIIKQILPPVLLRVVRYLTSQSKESSLAENTPTWNTVQSGPAKGKEIFVAKARPAFQKMIQGDYDEFFWRYLNEIDFAGKTILDIGAHIGYHSLCFSSLVGESGQVIVFEPNGFNLERMDMMLDRNKSSVRNIDVKRVALANFEGKAEFYFSRNVDNETSSGGFIEGSDKPLSDADYEKAGFEEKLVDVVPLDKILAEQHVGEIALMKLDVEGAEGMVLAGAMSILEKHKPIMLIEVHSVIAMLRVCETLHSLNYKVEVIDEDCASRCFVVANPQ